MLTSLGRKKAKRQKLILSDEQFGQLLRELGDDVRLMVETAISTGMRVSEIISLKWRYVDLDRGLIRVEERYYRGDTDEPKSERSRRFLSLGLLLEDYRSWKPAAAGPDDYVFQRDGNPMDDRRLLRKELRPVAKRLGSHFPGFGWHTFRRQNITLIQEEATTPFEAQAQAGHSKPNDDQRLHVGRIGSPREGGSKSATQAAQENRLSGSNAGIVRDFQAVE